MIGKGEYPLTEIKIAPSKGGIRDQRGVWRASVVPPFMPKKITDDYHPGGNSACYTIQTAHLMGCEQIYLLGFTLESGVGYHFGLTNPVTQKRSFYSAEAPLHWLSWYEKCYPGRVKLMPGWQGPIYDVFETADLETLNG